MIHPAGGPVQCRQDRCPGTLVIPRDGLPHTPVRSLSAPREGHAVLIRDGRAASPDGGSLPLGLVHLITDLRTRALDEVRRGDVVH